MKAAAAAATAAAAVCIGVFIFSFEGGNATKLQSREKFFSQLAAGALRGSLQTLIPQQTAALSPPFFNPAAAAGAAAGAAAETPQIPAVDAEKTAKLETMQKLLDRKIQQNEELKEKLQAELKFMKEEGLLETNKGAAALQAKRAATGQTGAIGGMLPDLAAPVIFLEPPPGTQSQTLEAADVAETTLAQIGDRSSPAMRAVREYEMKKLGEISGTTLEQIRSEIRETESAIEKRKKERNELTNKLKNSARELAKSGNRQLELEATFANADLKEKSRELDILADKLTQLKTRERDLIEREGPGSEAAEQLGKEEEEEEELAAEMEGEEE